MKKELRTRRGLGSLYKRDASGKEYPANSKKAGIYWIAYQQDGKRIRQPLTKDGKPITDYDEAKAEQERIRNPFITTKGIKRKKREKAALVKIQAELKKVTGDILELEDRQEKELDQATPPLSIADAWGAFVSSTRRPDAGVRTMEDYETHFRAFRSWLDSLPTAERPVYLRDITEDQASRYMGHIVGSGKSNNTYNKKLTFLKMFFRVLFETAKLNINPFIKFIHKTEIQNSRRELTIAELQKIISTAEGDLKLLLSIGIVTGLRLGDCCTLKWGEIDLIRRLILRKPRKTAKRTRMGVKIGIPPFFIPVLGAIPEEQRTGYLLPRFANLYLGEHGTGNVTRIIQAHFHKCGIATHAEGTGAKCYHDGKKKVYEKRPRAVVEVGFHSLRHTWVSIHAMGGTPQGVIQDSAGHSNPAMTQHYTHVNEESAADAAKVLDLPELAAAMDAEIIPDTTQDRLSRMKSALDTAAPGVLDEIEKILNLR